jgi:chemosensory pili system protein ChpA (sensor histidine kinase/response regulator)
MVGLTQLGDIAYEVERIHNRLLEEERPVTPAVLSMISTSEHDFRGWVEALVSERRVTADPAPIAAAIRAVEAELGGGAVHRPPPAKPLSIAPPPRSAPGVEPPRAEAPRLPELEIVELPELGAAPADAPRVAVEEDPPGETIEVAPAHRRLEQADAARRRGQLAADVHAPGCARRVAVAGRAVQRARVHVARRQRAVDAFDRRAGRGRARRTGARGRRRRVGLAVEVAVEDPV